MKFLPARYELPPWMRYAVAIALILGMIVMRFALFDTLQGRYPLVLFLVPVIVGTWVGGTRVGLLAAVFGPLIGACLPTPYNFEPAIASNIVRLSLFLTVSVVCILVITQLRKTMWRAEEARLAAEATKQKLQAEIFQRGKIEEDLRNEVAVRKKAEKNLADALEGARRASIAKSEFLANISHEIRTPMNSVVGLTNILAITGPLTAKQQEFVRTLKLSADALLSLINDMLDISKIEANSIELEAIAFDLRQLTEDVQNIMAVKAKEKNLIFRLDAAGLKEAEFVGDATRIKQIIMNLCSNAIKFTESGTVSISLATLSATERGAVVAIVVKDTGIGISSDKIATIFDKFVQADSTISRKYGGTGLGLSITKNLVELMGGQISVGSEEDLGSTFTIQLPLRRPTSSDAALVRLTPSLAQHEFYEPSKRVLLVEDNEANILVATSFLDHFGFQFDVATNGVDALRMIEDNKYFVVLMDLQMQGLDGFETTRQIRARERALKIDRLYIIGMTAHAMAEDKDCCLKSGMDDHISKPFDPETLKQKLKSVYSLDADFSPKALQGASV